MIKINKKEYFKAYREKNKDKMKAYYEKNKDKIKAYREKNKDKIAKQKKAYYEKNKDKMKASREKKYYMEKMNLKRLTPRQILKIVGYEKRKDLLGDDEK
jgi:hypothetical protein